MELDLVGRTVVISGAASGIGRACAGAFAAEGARIGLLDIDGTSAAGLTDELLTEYDAECSFVAADISEELEVSAAVESLAARFGGIDIVVNCAGVSGPFGADVGTIETAAFDAVLAVNVRGPFLLAKHAVKYLADGCNPAIVLIGSDSSFVAAPGMLPYNASKGAVLQMTRALSVDLADRGIRVNCVCPSIVDTPMARADLGPAALATATYPVQAPAQVADQVLWLASTRSAPMNGASLVSDFGHLARSSFPA